jgi:hypothetical protein
MGEGINGAIPISFKFAKGYWNGRAGERAEFKKYAANDIFDFYNQTKVRIPKNEGGGTYTLYTIKPEILLPNFKDFFLKFHKLLRDEWTLSKENISKKFNKRYDKAVASGDIEMFLEHFDDDTGRVPLRISDFDALYIERSGDYLIVYHGSYKAYLERWSTLQDMELLLRAAMQNPLAKVVRFGII